MKTIIYGAKFAFGWYIGKACCQAFFKILEKGLIKAMLKDEKFMSKIKEDDSELYDWIVNYK